MDQLLWESGGGRCYFQQEDRIKLYGGGGLKLRLKGEHDFLKMVVRSWKRQESRSMGQNDQGTEFKHNGRRLNEFQFLRRTFSKHLECG